MYNEPMNKQVSLSAPSDELTKVWTKRKEFLTQIERFIPWAESLALIQPCYYNINQRGMH